MVVITCFEAKRTSVATRVAWLCEQRVIFVECKKPGCKGLGREGEPERGRLLIVESPRAKGISNLVSEIRVAAMGVDFGSVNGWDFFDEQFKPGYDFSEMRERNRISSN